MITVADKKLMQHPRANRLDPDTAARSLASRTWVSRSGRETPLRKIAQPHLDNIIAWIPKRLGELSHETRFDNELIVLCQLPRITMPRHEMLTKLGMPSMPAVAEAEHWKAWLPLLNEEAEYRTSVLAAVEILRCAADDVYFRIIDGEDLSGRMQYRIGLAGLRCNALHYPVSLALMWSQHVATEYAWEWDDLDEQTIYLEAALRLEEQ